MGVNQPTVGLSMIVKDAAHMLFRILDKIDPASVDAFDQVVILDTGSSDGTVQMLREKYPWVEVHEAKWAFDFSKARNESLSYLKTDVWMWLDADDTFDERALERWLEIAAELYEKRNEKDHPVYALIPYYYQVDEHDHPLVVHFRERILLGTKDWEWREPLHEVCCYTGEKGYHTVYNDCPVVHKPLGDNVAAVNNDRNWKILAKHFLDGDRSDRTLYYLGRMAVHTGQHEFTIQVASELMNREPGGYYEYESIMAVGKAWLNLYKRDGVEDYKTRAIEVLTRAKRFDPSRNDARVELTDLYVYCHDVENALKEANAMNEAMPVTVAATHTEIYGRYKFAALAMIHFRLSGNSWEAVRHQLKALDCPKPHPMAYKVDESLRAFLEDSETTTIYCDEKYNGQAMAVRDSLLRRGLFREVLVFNDPRCINYARNWFFHITEKTSTLYQDDGHPRLRKVLISPRVVGPFQNPEKEVFGYEIHIAMPNSPAVLEECLDDLFSDFREYSVGTLPEALELAKGSRYPKVGIGFANKYGGAFPSTADYEKENPTPRNKIRFIVNKKGELIGLIGWADNISSLYIDKRGILRTSAFENCVSEVVDEDIAGIPFRIEATPAPKKDVVIFAPGIEEWNGRTPRLWGIGASESCVVYMAEEMVKRGHKVTVYNTISKSCIVGGVGYININQYHDQGRLHDLVIASRIPEALAGDRKAKVQVLWMHDIAEAYAHRLNNNQTIDRFITISKWQQAQAVKYNYKASKCRRIPNGVVKWPSFSVERVKGRTLWSSQPERGLDNLYQMWKADNDLFADTWVVYGFWNLLNYARSDSAKASEAFYDACRYKYALHRMGAKIIGRVPHSEVQRLAQTADRWVYPSQFPETYCVAGLEMLYNGVHCFFTDNGATSETLHSAELVADEGRRFGLTTGYGRFEFARDSKEWLKTLNEQASAEEEEGVQIGFANDDLHWESIGDKWEELLDGRA